MSSSFSFLIIVQFILIFAEGVYETGNFDLTPSEELPYHVEIFFPKEAKADLPLLYFSPGLGGYVPTFTYSDVMHDVASRGVVIAGVDITWPVLEVNFNSPFMGWNITKYELTLDYLEKNLNIILKNMTKNTEVNFKKITLAGHSGGADVAQELISSNCERYTGGAIILEGGTIPKIDNNVEIPLLYYVTELDKKHESGGGPCDPTDVEQLYLHTQGPKGYLNITTFGHCDCLNNLWWHGCRAAHACSTVAGTDRKHYREWFAQMLWKWTDGIVNQNSDSIFGLFDERTWPPNITAFDNQHNFETMPPAKCVKKKIAN